MNDRLPRAEIITFKVTAVEKCAYLRAARARKASLSDLIRAAVARDIADQLPGARS